MTIAADVYASSTRAIVFLGMEDEDTGRRVYVLGPTTARTIAHQLLAAAAEADDVTRQIDSIVEELGVSRGEAYRIHAEEVLTRALTKER